jgi:hypothetical protein
MTPCERLLQGIGELYVCSPVNHYVRIRTPYLYPDGDVIDLYLVTNGEHATLTDYGETLRWLKSQTPSQKRTVKQNQLIEDICLNHGVEFYSGMLMLRVGQQDNMANVVSRLAQAIVRVSDLYFTFRKRSTESLTEDVNDFLSERAIPFERGPQIPGRSGKIWKVDFHVRTPQRSSLVNVLSTGSRATARGIVEHVVAAWFDLSPLRLGQQPQHFVSLFDDTVDVWSPEDIQLVGELSDIAYWSRPEEFEGLLRAA